MRCPKCGSDDDKVLDSRTVRDGAAIRRRRECIGCGYRFTTHEEIDRDEVTVVKRDGTREPFSRAVLIAWRALSGTPPSCGLNSVPSISRNIYFIFYYPFL